MCFLYSTSVIAGGQKALMSPGKWPIHPSQGHKSPAATKSSPTRINGRDICYLYHHATGLISTVVCGTFWAESGLMRAEALRRATAAVSMTATVAAATMIQAFDRGPSIWL
jgi:hypothetical protein